MALQPFSFPVPETRFFKAGSFIYKFKIRGGSSYSGEEITGRNCFSQEMEEIIRTVLGNLDDLQPFSSTHFNVFPYKKRWEGTSKEMCKHREGNLKAYPFILVLYLEKNGKQAEENLSSERETLRQISLFEPRSKHRKTDSPLEEAILKDLMKDLEAESKISAASKLHRDNPYEGEEVKTDPRYFNKKGAYGFDDQQQASGFSTVSESGTPSQMQHGIINDMDEGEPDEEGDDADSVPKSPVKPGILTRLASHIFPFSLFFRDP